MKKQKQHLGFGEERRVFVDAPPGNNFEIQASGISSELEDSLKPADIVAEINKTIKKIPEERREAFFNQVQKSLGISTNGDNKNALFPLEMYVEGEVDLAEVNEYVDYLNEIATAIVVNHTANQTIKEINSSDIKGRLNWNAKYKKRLPEKKKIKEAQQQIESLTIDETDAAIDFSENVLLEERTERFKIIKNLQEKVSQYEDNRTWLESLGGKHYWPEIKENTDVIINSLKNDKSFDMEQSFETYFIQWDNKEGTSIDYDNFSPETISYQEFLNRFLNIDASSLLQKVDVEIVESQLGVKEASFEQKLESIDISDKEIKTILDEHTTYNSGDWRIINQKLADIFGIQIDADGSDKSIAFGKAFQEKVVDLHNEYDDMGSFVGDFLKEHGHDGMVGKETLDFLRKYLVDEKES